MYKVKFTDGSEFTGGTIEDSKWNEMPDKEILEIDYFLGEKFKLSGFKEYNQLVTKVITINPKTQKQQIQYTELFLMGYAKGKVHILKFDFNSRQCSLSVSTKAKAYYGRSVTGWKKGDLNCGTLFIGRV